MQKLLQTTCTLLVLSLYCNAQDSTRVVRIYDRTLVIPAAFQQVESTTDYCGGGYITDGIDTLYYNRCAAMLLPMSLMIEPLCEENESSRCREERESIRRRNDSIRAQDSRIGKYHWHSERGKGCWYDILYPLPGVDGRIDVEISYYVHGHVSFLLSTTVIDAVKQRQWKNILRSISK